MRPTVNILMGKSSSLRVKLSSAHHQVCYGTSVLRAENKQAIHTEANYIVRTCGVILQHDLYKTFCSPTTLLLWYCSCRFVYLLDFYLPFKKCSDCNSLMFLPDHLQSGPHYRSSSLFQYVPSSHSWLESLTRMHLGLHPWHYGKRVVWTNLSSYWPVLTLIWVQKKNTKHY